MFITYRLQKTLRKIGITRNTLAVESKVRPNTIADLANGKTKSINIQTMMKILATINRIAEEKGIEPNFGIEDIFLFEYKTDLTKDIAYVAEENLGLNYGNDTYKKKVEMPKLSDPDFKYRDD